MKKLFASLAAVLVSVAMSAQIYVGGGLNVKSNSDATGFGVAPEVGYVLNENLAIGGMLNFDVADVDAIDAFNLDIKPYARYTFLKAGNFSLFADGVIDLNYNGGASEFNFQGVYVQPGVSYAFNEKFSIAARMGQIGYVDNAVNKETILVAPSTEKLAFTLYYTF
jgi:hypothetical protein